MVWSSDYEPYGLARNTWGSAVSNYRFTDQEYDPETGLYSYNARLYDPAIGRFISPDSIVQNPYSSIGLNRYAYVGNNPLKYTDPSGHFAMLAAIAYGALIGGTVAAITGGDIMTGMITGAISGAMFGMAGQAVLANGYGLAGKIGVHAMAGAFSGGYGSAITGGNPMTAIALGGISGAAGSLAGGALPNNFGAQFAGQTVAGGLAGGIGSELMGGDFGQGFVQGAKMAAIGYLANDMLHEAAIRGQRIVAIAKKWLGVPYSQTGGNTRNGVDCSHLVNEVYAEAGLPYPYANTKTFSTQTKAYFDLIPAPMNGDVVLYEGHMGIYTDGKIISAQSGAGMVTSGSLDWFPNFVGYYRYK